MSKQIVVLTGAGISAESGIQTFRDANGLWENHRIEDVATPEAWRRNRALVLEFYNRRRQQLKLVTPNDAHVALVKLESRHNVQIITQNVDDLHERAGSKRVLHLHGELMKARSTADERLVYPWKNDIREGDHCEKGSQLRPHIVWFGETVPMLEMAAQLVAEAETVLIIGASMQVYPAAGLVSYAPPFAEVFYVDPNPSINLELSFRNNLKVIAEKASTGVRKVVDGLV
jgi:NAD-dependent deacetylase